jgi:hypothetical protein
VPCQAQSCDGSVGMAVKEAMNALAGDHQNASDDPTSAVQTNPSKNDHHQGEVGGNGSMGQSGTGSGLGSSTSTGAYNNNNNPSSVHSSNSLSNDSCSVKTSQASSMSSSNTSSQNPVGPPPPYRTATLVFKLLQIGNYQFRSFSEINPNRLRVLFNTQ